MKGAFNNRYWAAIEVYDTSMEPYGDMINATKIIDRFHGLGSSQSSTRWIKGIHKHNG